MVDIWDPEEQPHLKRNLHRETYDAGDDEKFETFLTYVQSERVRSSIRKIRLMLKMNNDLVFWQAYRILEKIVGEYVKGKLEIQSDDYMAWEMIARNYETIADRYSPKTNPEGGDLGICIRAYDRAINFYAKAQKHKRARRAYEKSPIKEVMDRVHEHVRKKGPNAELEKLLSQLP